jgi:hypothetical protein
VKVLIAGLGFSDLNGHRFLGFPLYISNLIYKYIYRSFFGAICCRKSLIYKGFKYVVNIPVRRFVDLHYIWGLKNAKSLILNV